jgi:hypothetical protein
MVFSQGGAGLRANDPTALAQAVSGPLPRFWIMRGTRNSTDTTAAGYFEQVISGREKTMNVVVEGGTHTPPAWRAALPSLLSWTWNTLSGGAVGCGQTYIPLGKQPAGPPVPSSSPAHKV